MKFNRKVLSMTLGGAALPWGLAAANESLPLPKSLSSVGRIGDTDPALSHSDISPQRAILKVDHRPEAFRQNVVVDDPHPDSEYLADDPDQVPIRSVGYAIEPSDYDLEVPTSGAAYESSMTPSSDCASTCCDSGDCGIGLGCGLSNLLGWGEVESLLWWGPNVQSPPLVAEGPRGQPVNTIVAGGAEAPLGGEMQVGLRANVGVWLDDCQTIGAGGRVFGILSDGSSETYSSQGDPTLGVPYFSVVLGAPVEYPVALDTLTNGVSTGSITVDLDTDFIAAEAYGRFLLAKSGSSRADMVGGYTFARLDDYLGLHTRSVDGITNPTVDGTISETLDQFSTKNTFHGGHIGFTTDITRGRWTFSTLSKVALGNMNQQSTTAGSFVVTPPNPPGGAPATGNIGLLAQNSNIGSRQRDVFTFLPEAGAKLRYCLTSKLKLNVGYTFLFFPDVVMAGNMIDPVLDLSSTVVQTAPQNLFGHDTYYLHGIDLGLTYQY